MSTWPAALPHPLLSSYHNADRFLILKTAMESGPPRRALKSTHYMTTGQITMVLDVANMAIFQQMLLDSRHTADWITGCPIDTGSGVRNHRIRISSVQRKVTLPPDKLWTVTISFETDEHL